MDDQGEYILNGYNVITQYPRIFPYGGVTFEYTGTNSTLERVNTTFARRLKRDLTVVVSGNFKFKSFFDRRMKSVYRDSFFYSSIKPNRSYHEVKTM